MKTLLEVKDLQVYFPIKTGFWQRTTDYVRAVDGVSFVIEKGTTVGLVGESGSGKSTIGRSIVKLTAATGGKILYENANIGVMGSGEFMPYRKKIQMIFQDPFNSLNPRLRIATIVGESLEIHFPSMSRRDREGKVVELLEKVGLKAEHLFRFPHEFSGGQRQRIGIARALAVEPELIICDEPVSALDVSVQAQIVNLFQDLQEEMGLTYLFIAHDLAVVEHISDHVLVMHHGKIVESASAEEIYARPQHEYTRKLLSAVPSIE